MDKARAMRGAVAIEGDLVVAHAVERHGLDDRTAPTTRVIDEPHLTLLPTFLDNHNHLTEAGRNSLFVAVGHARTIGELVDLVRERAASCKN